MALDPDLRVEHGTHPLLPASHLGWRFPEWTALAFLLLGGPTSIVPAPQDRTRRLTGGWAFLISLVVGSAVASTL